MAQPQSKQEYEQRFAENMSLSGYGLDVTQHMPCPFCAAPAFVTYRIMEMTDVLSKGAECKECGRAMKIIFETDGQLTVMRMVQTKGDAPPPWVVPMERRF